MNMENENVQMPSFEELQEAYTHLAQQAQELDRRYQAILQDKTLEKIATIGRIIEHKDLYSKKIVKLAEWHLAKMLEKPKA
jgi:hypothetical protein